MWAKGVPYLPVKTRGFSANARCSSLALSDRGVEGPKEPQVFKAFIALKRVVCTSLKLLDFSGISNLGY